MPKKSRKYYIKNEKLKCFKLFRLEFKIPCKLKDYLKLIKILN